MSSFNATDPLSTPAVQPSSSIVTNDGFFPDINTGMLRDVMRLDSTVTDARLVDAVIAAVISVNKELESWKAMQIDAGIVALADIGPKIGGIGQKMARYFAAIYRTTKADLTERYRDFDSTKAGIAEAEKLELSIDDHRREARWAVRDILGLPRSTIELI